MKVRDRALLADYIREKDFSQARLGRYAGCSRQFIHQLVTGEKTTCTPTVGRLIEEALGVLPKTLFVPKDSPQTRSVVKPETTSQCAPPLAEKVPA
ncbi:MAG: helix-turn-helix domain-containing protein [Cellulomonas sp.]|nr:helix-turn-helix transcriptional regulator [Cellulomonas sp.]MCR6647766.1 helix-turn-helix domain-containing protein [Cellulomonas sp.]